MIDRTTVSSLMKEWNEHLLSEEVSAFTEMPEAIQIKKSMMGGAADATYASHRSGIDDLMTKAGAALKALDKQQKKDADSWAHVKTASEIHNQLSNINQMLNI